MKNYEWEFSRALLSRMARILPLWAMKSILSSKMRIFIIFEDILYVSHNDILFKSFSELHDSVD